MAMSSFCKIVLAVSYKVKHWKWLASILDDISSFIYICPKVETTRVSYLEIQMNELLI